MPERIADRKAGVARSHGTNDAGRTCGKKLVVHMTQMVNTGAAQFVIATHFPILTTFPGAQIVNFDEPARLPDIALEDTPHYQITRGILDDPEQYWRHLQAPAD